MTLPGWTPTLRQVRWLMLIALVPFAVVAVARRGEAPSVTDGDYAQYLLHAKAIADGRPYSDIGYIYSDLNLIGPRNQPPGWPLVLAPFVAAFGVHSPVFRILVTVLVAAFAVTAGMYFVHHDEPLAGVAVAMAVPLALETQYATGSALSDPLFCLVLWIVLALADARGELTWRRALAIALLTAGAISVRVAGIALVPALLLQALMRRKWQWRVTAPMLLLLAAALAIAVFGAEQVPFLAKFLARGILRVQPLGVLATYRDALSAGALFPFRSNGANDIYHAVAAVPLVAGAILFLRRRAGSALWCFTLSYVALLALSPVRESRYAWPLAPLVMMCFVTGLSWLGSRLRDGTLRRAVPNLVAVVTVAIVLGAALQLLRVPPRQSLLHDPDTADLFEWVRRAYVRDPVTVRVVFSNPRVLTLETGASAMGIPAGPEGVVIDELVAKRISHVVVPLMHVTRMAERNLARLVGDRPDRFPEAFRNGSYDVRRFVVRTDSVSGTASIPVPPPSP